MFKQLKKFGKQNKNKKNTTTQPPPPPPPPPPQVNKPANTKQTDDKLPNAQDSRNRITSQEIDNLDENDIDDILNEIEERHNNNDNNNNSNNNGNKDVNWKEILLYGYVRTIETILNAEIPTSIYAICLEYYSNYVKVLERIIFGVLFSQTNKLQLIQKLKHYTTKLTRVNTNDEPNKTAFLIALGYECDETNNLILKRNPTQQIIQNTLYVLNKYQNTFDNINKYTLKELILYAIENDKNYLIWSILLTYSIFTDSITLLATFTAIIATNEKYKSVIVNIVKYWMNEYWQEDFYQNKGIYMYIEGYNWFEYQVIKTQFEKLQKLPFKQLNNHYETVNTIEFSAKDSATRKYKIAAKDIATQITLLNYALFGKIRSRECIKGNWKSNHNRKLSPNILEFIEQFNNFTIFTQIQILRERSVKNRVKAIEHFIKIGEYLRQWKNYNGLCAVFSSMNSAPIHRLQEAWRKVSQKDIDKFNKWQQIFSRDNNHANLRLLVRTLDNKPCIPHIGIFLQDLIFLEEGEDINNIKYKSYNFHKYIDIAQMIKCLHSFQNNGYSELIEDKVVQNGLLAQFDRLKDVTEDQIWDMSTEIRKQDQREVGRL